MKLDSAGVVTFSVQPTVCGGCGHQHGGADVGFISIGCPCPERMGAAIAAPPCTPAATLDLDDTELDAAETLIGTLERLNVRAAVDRDAMQAARLLHRMAAEIRRRRASSKRIRELVPDLDAVFDEVERARPEIERLRAEHARLQVRADAADKLEVELVKLIPLADAAERFVDEQGKRVDGQYGLRDADDFALDQWRDLVAALEAAGR